MLSFLFLPPMNELPGNKKKLKLFSLLEVAIIVCLACVPLFFTFPYRVNIFLSWEGAYRLSQGQIPYKDFGMPMGYMYWVIPAIFFKILGTQMITLVKAQVFINIISGLAFRSILKNLAVQPGIRLLCVLLYCISYSFFNFWPWYNHTVIVYEMIGLAFLLNYIFDERSRWIWLSLSALFTFFSFFTKQDGGGLAILLSLTLVFYHCLHEKKWMSLIIYLASLVTVAFALIASLAQYNFGYWFNHGQPPHTSRISFFEIADEFFAGSQWIKFYFFMIVILAMAHYKNWKEVYTSKRSTIFLLLTLGVLAEATVIQMTSYTPPDNNIFFHSFAFAFILSFISEFLHLNFYKIRTVMVSGCFLLLWWSGVYWKYFQRITQKFKPPVERISPTGENVVNRQTYMLSDNGDGEPVSDWAFTGLKSFEKIYMPGSTVDGIHRLLNMDLVKHKKNLCVLNMSELTPLAVEMPYQLEKGPDIPLWYHLGVSMFNKETKTFEQKIAARQYDLVLFEYIPTLNNFYPFRVRDSLLLHYQKVDSFLAPRRGVETKGMIEVYVKP
jgi:hypothetical protein